MDIPSLLIGLLAGLALASALYFGTERSWDRRAPTLELRAADKFGVRS